MPTRYTLRRRVIRGVGLQTPTAPEAPEPEPTADTEASVDFDKMLKVDLVAYAEERGIDASGTKAEIVERLR
jgi:hypothetical protein